MLLSINPDSLEYATFTNSFKPHVSLLKLVMYCTSSKEDNGSQKKL